MGHLTAADKIVNFLRDNPTSELLPIDIAMATGINRHTVRRTMGELAKAGEVVKVDSWRGCPIYRIAPQAEMTAHTADPAQ